MMVRFKYLVGDVYCIFVTFPCDILGQVRYLSVSFPDLCHISYFYLDPLSSHYQLKKKRRRKTLSELDPH